MAELEQLVDASMLNYWLIAGIIIWYILAALVARYMRDGNNNPTAWDCSRAIVLWWFSPIIALVLGPLLLWFILGGIVLTRGVKR